MQNEVRTCIAGIFMAAVLSGCASNSAPGGHQDLVAPPDGQAQGCWYVTGSSSTTSCREDWSCSEAGMLTVLCTTFDAGRSCACMVGQSMTNEFSAPDAACGGDAGNRALMASCGWDVSQ